MSRKHRRQRFSNVAPTKGPSQRLHGVPGFRGPELVVMVCPQCNKRRMHRSKGHIVSQLKHISKDNAIQRYTDVCDACLRRYAIEDTQFEKRAKIAEEALKVGKDVGGNASIEDAL